MLATIHQLMTRPSVLLYEGKGLWHCGVPGSPQVSGLRSQSLTLIQVLRKVELVHMQHHHGVQGCIDLHGPPLHMPCPPAATWSDTTWMAKRSIQWRCRTREEVASKCLFYLGHPHLSRNCSSSLPWTTSCFYIDQSRQIIAVAWVITSNNSSNLGLWEEVVDATLDLANIMLSTG